MRLLQILIALDQLANTLAGGWADESWSARCWREGRWRWVRFLDRFERDHCRLSYESELQRRQLPPEYRQKSDAASQVVDLKSGDPIANPSRSVRLRPAPPENTQ